MKNYWLKLHRDRNSSFWTTEFFTTNLKKSILTNRKAKILNPNQSLGDVGVLAREITLIFSGAMANANDVELVNFIYDCQLDMSSYKCTLKNYKNLTDLARTCVLSDLRFESIASKNMVDLDLTFSYYIFKENWYS